MALGAGHRRAVHAARRADEPPERTPKRGRDTAADHEAKAEPSPYSASSMWRNWPGASPKRVVTYNAQRTTAVIARHSRRRLRTARSPRCEAERSGGAFGEIG